MKYILGRGAYRGSFRGTNVEAEDLFERVFGKYSEFAADDHDYDPDNSRSEKGRDEFGSLREISVSLSFVEAARGMQKVVDLIYDVSGCEGLCTHVRKNKKRGGTYARSLIQSDTDTYLQRQTEKLSS